MSAREKVIVNGLHVRGNSWTLTVPLHIGRIPCYAKSDNIANPTKVQSYNYYSITLMFCDYSIWSDSRYYHFYRNSECGLKHPDHLTNCVKSSNKPASRDTEFLVIILTKLLTNKIKLTIMFNDLDYWFKPIVLITGFGPYLNHPVNASWEAVKIMNKDEIEKKHNVELVQIELPVTYENVDEFVPALWETHTPKLMIHVGVSSKGQCLQLESRAHRKGYQKMDYFDKLPANCACLAEGAIRLHTKLNVEQICKEFNGDNPPDEKYRAEVSNDAGRYLCEYIYYTSLSIDNTRTLFVHVPVMDIYPSEETARGLERIVSLCLAQISEKGDGTDQVTEGVKNAKLDDNGDSNIV